VRCFLDSIRRSTVNSIATFRLHSLSGFHVSNLTIYEDGSGVVDYGLLHKPIGPLNVDQIDELTDRYFVEEVEPNVVERISARYARYRACRNYEKIRRILNGE
jgi:hypothetical protein